MEFQIIERAAYRGSDAARPWWGPDTWVGLTARSAEQAGIVPDDVEVGFHLCYGDANEQHFVEPADAANLVRFANGLFAASPRTITWLHLPVPIERDDDAYFAPLRDLDPPEGNELHLGPVHREDGAEGARMPGGQRCARIGGRFGRRVHSSAVTCPSGRRCNSRKVV